MGGAVALLIHREDPAFWHGAVLVAPMCKVGTVSHFPYYCSARMRLFYSYLFEVLTMALVMFFLINIKNNFFF